MAQRFRKKPVQVEAVRWDGENADEVAEFIGRDGKIEERRVAGPGRGLQPGIVIHTLEGDMTATVGDWIIRGVQGEFYPCKPDIFEATYEEVPG
jgi:hypothetical protein